MTANFGIFLLSIVGISLTGVMGPGPVLAATIAKGYEDKNAGAKIAIGHGIIELPIIALIYFGFTTFFTSPDVKKVIGLIGGFMLMFMGITLLRTMKKSVNEATNLPYNSFITGILTTVANPYFFIWWATIGAALVISATEFGIYGLLVFVVVHWCCDLVWDQLISFTVFRTRHLWTKKVRTVIFGICAVVLIGFGLWYGVSVFLL
jgi:threonine/homoserine/homoserine lactone efflux protein